MPSKQPDPDQAMQKLGQRVREGHAILNPVADKDVEIAKHAVREQWEKEQKEKHQERAKTDTAKQKEKTKEIEPPDRD